MSKDMYEEAVLRLDGENDLAKRREILENLKTYIESAIQLGDKINRILFIGTSFENYFRELVDMYGKIRMTLWDNSLNIN